MVIKLDDLCLSSLLGWAGVTEKKVIHTLGIDKKTWEQWLFGMSEPDELQREQLARLLHCPISAIHRAVARNRARWVDSQFKDDAPVQVNRRYFPQWWEILVQVIVSIVTTVIVNLIISGKL